MLLAFLKAFIIGVLAAIPPGPVALLVMQKTFTRGRWAGVVTGMGSMVIDSLYAFVAMMAVGVVLDTIHLYEAPILLVGGAVVAAVGFNMFMKKPAEDYEGNSNKKTAVGYAFQCAGCALANPGAIAMILALVAFAGFSADTVDFPMWLLVPFVALGELTYWFFYTMAVKKLRRAVTSHSLTWINRIAGAVVIVLGIVLLIRGAIMF